jgi:hypothetical protein
MRLTRPVVLGLLLAGAAALSGCARPLVVNMTPLLMSGETWQDSEPFLAVHPGNPQVMAASAFTPNPFGAASGTAPIYVTAAGGVLWTLNNVVPSTIMTSDITHAFDRGSGDLYAGILHRPGGLLLNTLVTSDALAPLAMTVLSSRSNVDQPFTQVSTAGVNDRVYVGNNDFGAAPRTATVDVSANGGASWTPARIEPRGTMGQNGPSVRPTVARDGTVYAAYFGWRTVDWATFVITSDVVVVRDDAGALGANAFQSLLDPGDGLPGRRVAQNVTIPWSNAPTLGQERIGSTLSLAVDPNNSAVVYVAWADRVGSGDIYTIHVRRSTDRGATWSGDLRTVTNATNVALAVADNGCAGLLYQQVVGAGTSARWVTRLEQSRDGFATVRDTILANVPASAPAPQFLPYIGDYAYVLAVGDEFRGIFSANNTPDLANFPQGVIYQRRADFATKTLKDLLGNPVAVSIDPYYFMVPVDP